MLANLLFWLHFPGIHAIPDRRSLMLESIYMYMPSADVVLIQIKS